MEEFDRTKPPQPSEIRELGVKGEQVRSVYDRDDSNTNQINKDYPAIEIVPKQTVSETNSSVITQEGNNSPATMEVNMPPSQPKDPEQTEISPIEK